MASAKPFVIVGGGLAGAKAAETLRTEGYDGDVVLVCEEDVRPYERPPLSKAYLRGEAPFDDAAVHGPDFYAENGIDLRLGIRATGLRTDRGELTLSSGDELAYEGLLLATGSRVRRLQMPGEDLDGVLYLRTVAESDTLRDTIVRGRRLVVIGAGWIGSEVAASARELGAEVDMVDVGSVPLERALGPEVGAVYRDLHRERGVHLHLGVGVAALEGDHRLERVRLTDGTVVETNAAVIGVGVQPDTLLASAAGLAVDNGIVVDEHLESSVPGVFAAGDVANAWHPHYGARIRLEHWSAALNQGPAAARNLLGKREVYDRVPYFFSDQYDTGMEYRGWAPKWDRVVFRGDVGARTFISFWLRDGHIQAAMNMNVWDAGDSLDALVRSRAAVDADLLADPAADLDQLPVPR